MVEKSHQHGHACCHHAVAPSVHQTLDEMNFERGVWSAAKDGDQSKVQRYLEEGGDPDALDSSGYSALLYASRSGHLRICEMLLRNGADCNFQTRSGGTSPLHRAAYCGHVPIVQLLVTKGADVLLQDVDGKTALHKAVENGKEKCATLLLEKNRRLLDIADNKGRRPIDYVEQDSSLLKILKENIDTS